MSSNNIKWAFNLFRSSSNTFKQSSLIFYGDQEILPQFLGQLVAFFETVVLCRVARASPEN